MKPNLANQAWNGAEKCKQCRIRELVLFAGLQQDDFEQLHYPIIDIELAPGETLYKEQQVPDFVFTVRSGMIKLVRYLPNGNYRVVRLLRQGDLAGIEALHDTAYLHHAIALQETSICRIPIKDIEQLNQQSSHLYKQLTARWYKVQSDADIWLSELTVGNSKKRVANLLLYLAQHNSTNYFYLPGRQDIGALLAITTETASRIIAEFKRLKYLQLEPQGALIDIDKLKQIA
ncbi:Crp/Fnr family transcriptional regulator [methanotrophic bacterial endosymbiont of Bathymodiolus sp.]|nr:Crp/Fnr family transcriptional regulator [methanotrophic bacterial endosymbiont of Bathymodiolus sp.]